MTNLDELKKLRGIDVDYLGVGPIYATATKPDHDPPLGLGGLRQLLELENFEGITTPNIPIVIIGGINTDNFPLLLHRTKSDRHAKISGPAVVSVIIAEEEPEPVCHKFRTQLDYTPSFGIEQAKFTLNSKGDLFTAMKGALIHARVSQAKMIHHITNDVVKNYSANICLTTGASPIMSENIEEVDELADMNGALVLNMGTAGNEAHPLFFQALFSNNIRGNPVVFDPVGAGASKLRRTTTAAIVRRAYCDVIKGNAGEIRTVAGENVVMRGVDSIPDGEEDLEESKEKVDDKPVDSPPAVVVGQLARKLGNIIVMTGVKDYISDGNVVLTLESGSPFQSTVTGTGCALGTFIASLLAGNRQWKLQGVLTAIILYNYAAQRAAEVAKGPATWSIAFIDWLWRLFEKESEELNGILDEALAGGPALKMKIKMESVETDSTAEPRALKEFDF